MRVRTKYVTLSSSLSLHLSLSLSLNTYYRSLLGNVLASVSKDRKLRLVDPRKGAAVAEAAAHQGVKPMKLAFASQANKILTTGA